MASLHRDTNVFASYAREDYERVRPFVEILRATDLRVFLDRDSIPPGKIWRESIENAIKQAKILFVFWSESASVSTFVRDEYELALILEKQVVPVMLDHTPLPLVLERIQGIDFRKQFALARDSESMAQEFYSAARGFINSRHRPSWLSLLRIAVFWVGLLFVSFVGWEYYSRTRRGENFSSIPVEIKLMNESPVNISYARFSDSEQRLIIRIKNLGEPPEAIDFLMELDCDDRPYFILLEYGNLSVRRDDYLDELRGGFRPISVYGLAMTDPVLDVKRLALMGEEEMVFRYEPIFRPIPSYGQRCSKKLALLSPVMATFADGSAWSWRIRD